jgi:Flp pilus assembly protein TadB
MQTDLNITKGMFLNAWNKFAPSKIERFYFKHFSSSTKDKKISWLVTIIFFVPFLVGLIGTILNANYNFLLIVTFIFAIFLVIFAIPWIVVWYMHNRRIRKIIKDLDCTMAQYNIAVGLWGNLIK